MNDLEKKSIECIKNMPIEETTYQVARNVVLDYITNLQEENQELNKENEKWWAIIKDDEQEIKDLCLENSKLEQENERLNREVAKLHIIQEEYGNHIENTHIIDDYQKTYFMTNKYLIELKNGKFVYVDELNDKYEDYKSRIEKAVEYIKEHTTSFGDVFIPASESWYLSDILNGRSDE